MRSMVGPAIRRAGVAWPVFGTILLLVAGAWTAPSALGQQPPTSPDDTLRELVERLLTATFPVPAGVAVPPVRLFPGALPPEAPITPPLPPGARLIGSVVRPVPFGGGPAGPEVAEGIEVVLDVPEPATAVLAFYERTLTEQGLTRPAAGGAFRFGGFLPSAGVTPTAFFCQSERGPFVEVAALPLRGGVTDVRLRIQPFPGPCGAPPLLPATPGPPNDPLPPLEPPAGVLVSPSGGSGSPFSRTFDAIADTELSVAALEAHYAAQLAAAGWERLGGGTDGALAWSLWRVPAGEPGPGALVAGGEGQGFLFVLEGPAPNRRSLHVQVVTAGGAVGSGGATIVIGPTVPVPLPAPPR